MKKSISIILSLVLMISTLMAVPFSAFAIDTLQASGKVNNSIDYTFDSSTGALFITGTGTIPSSAFKGFTEIKSVEIAGTITEIEDYVFNNCTKLNSVKLNEGIKKIGTYGYNTVFGNCYALKEIKLPDSLTYINYNCFDGCNALETFTFGSGLDTIPSEMFNDYTSLKTVLIPDGVCTIGNNAFSGSGLTSVTIPSTVTKIEYNAFKSCKDLNNVNIKSVGSLIIEDYVFNNCGKLNSVTIAEGLKEIGTYGYNAVFGNCYALKEIKLPNSLTYINYNCFEGCTSLEKVTFGSGLDDIPDEIFKNFSSLKTVVFPEGVRTIGNNAFYGTGLTSVTIPTSVSRIEYSAFNSCKDLKTVVVKGKGSLNFEDYVFDNCGRLSSVTLNEGVKEIGTYSYNTVFGNCYSLKSITLPKSLTHINYNCFEGCNIAVKYKGSINDWYFLDDVTNSYSMCNNYIVSCSNGVAGQKGVNLAKLSKSAFVYNGKVQKPSVKVTDKNGNTISSAYYTVTYSKGLKNVGKYTAKVTFKGYYSGTGAKTLSYLINPKGTAFAKAKATKNAFKVTWKKQAAQTTGYEVQYATNSKFTKGKKTKFFKNKATAMTVKKLKPNTKYYVRIRTYKTVGSKKYYSSWSKKTIKTTKK